MRLLIILSRRRSGGVAAVLLSALLLAVLATENPLPADAEAKKAAHPTDLAKIPSDGALVFSIRIAELWKSDLLKSVRGKSKEISQAAQEFEKRFGLSLEQVERLSMVFVNPPPGRHEPIFVVRTLKPYKLAKVLAADKKFEQQQYKGETVYVSNTGSVYPLDDRSLVFSESLTDIRALIDHPKPKEKGALADALARAAEKHTLVLGINAKPYYDSEGNHLPPEAEPFRPLFVAQRLTLAADIGAESGLSLALHFANEKDAKAAEKTAHSGLDLARATLDGSIKTLAKDKDKSDLVVLLKQLQAPLQAAKIERRGELLLASARARIDLAAGGVVVVQVAQEIREKRERIENANNLRQIVLALHNYADTNGGRFPAQAVYNKDGKPLLSWRVMILPYLDEEDLYKQFHLNEPWDSEHNKKLLAKMPRIYAAPQDGKKPKQHTTYYQCFAGKGAFFDGKVGLRVPADFPDGMSNTIMVVGASKAVLWTKPEDIPYDPDKPLPKLGWPDARGFSAAMCDGSVRWIAPTITLKTLRLAITRNDGQSLGSDF